MGGRYGSLPVGILRACSAGGGHWLGHNSTSFGGKYLCPAHLWSMMHGFNPQPHGVAGGTDQTVKFIDGSTPAGVMHAERHEPEYVVLSREGDELILRWLGLPDGEKVTASVHSVYPASPGAVYRHAAKCGPRPTDRRD
jgi:hypothetical protein